MNPNGKKPMENERLVGLENRIIIVPFYNIRIKLANEKKNRNQIRWN